MPATRPFPTLLLLAALALPAGAASAQSTAPANAAAVTVERQGAADDEVSLELAVEDWVETRTATVQIAADLAVESGRFGAARQDLVTTLQGFGTGAEWRIVNFVKLGDDAGFERWHMIAEARVPEASLSDLAGKAKAATRPGQALTVASIAYTPTLAEREAVVDRLRAQIYARVAREIAALNAAFPERRFRVRSLVLGTVGRPMPQMMAMARADSAAAGKAMGGAGLAGAEKASLTAQVTLAAAVASK